MQIPAKIGFMLPRHANSVKDEDSGFRPEVQKRGNSHKSSRQVCKRRCVFEGVVNDTVALFQGTRVTILIPPPRSVIESWGKKHLELLTSAVKICLSLAIKKTWRLGLANTAWGIWPNLSWGIRTSKFLLKVRTVRPIKPQTIILDKRMNMEKQQFPISRFGSSSNWNNHLVSWLALDCLGFFGRYHLKTSEFKFVNAQAEYPPSLPTLCWYLQSSPRPLLTVCRIEPVTKFMERLPQGNLTYPKNPWTLQWRGLNLYSRGLGPQNSHFWGVRILRVDTKNCDV